MKKSEGALISPDADGWRVREGKAVARKYPTLGEAAAALPLNTAVRLALPCQAALLERLTFPATDREELAGMLQLQLEKTLPYPVDEVSTDFEVISSAENGSTLLSIATHSGQLDDLCQPLRDQEKLPQKITLFAMHVAAVCPADETVLAVYAEQGQLVVALCERGKLSWAQTLPGLDAEMISGELPHALLGAELEGVPTNFTGIILDREVAALEETLRTLFRVRVELISLDEPLPEPSGNLLPSSWRAATRQIARAETLKQRLLLAGVVYLLLVAAAFVYLAWLKREAQKIAVQLAAARPQLEQIQTRQVRWTALRLAFDPALSTVEILYQAHRGLPSEQIRITEFSQTLGRWTIVGEAPSRNLALEYVEKLKAEPELSAWNITAPPLTLLKGEQAKFSIEGRQ
ncbi:MAG TPA: hypothetical protein VF593_03650 [Chthoniobacteraceae bacterium]|jgi:hypothetical protein